MSTENSNGLPTSIAEAVQMIRGAFPASELQSWLEEPESGAMISAHFGLGMWLRNQWIHVKGCPLADEYRAYTSFADGDEVSSMMVEDIWRHMKGLEPIERTPDKDRLFSEPKLTFD